MTTTLKSLFIAGAICLAGSARGQAPASESRDAAYVRTTTERAAKIVANLGLTDAAASARVQAVIAQQYRDLNSIHERRKEALQQLSDAAQPENKEAGKAKIEAETSEKIQKLHGAYLTKLAEILNPKQIEQVKDGMTYGVVPITYKGYQDMLPNLTDGQKQQILAYLIEARERAMDEGSSEKKHAMFGKYKGRINNYLSAAGIDMKKASKDWEARLANEKEADKSPK